ncbi:MAG: GNAT family N-acetyltransferase, partial [Dehalococcoidia bacterium]
AGTPVGTFQLTYIPYLTHSAALRAVVEAVRITSERRGTGLGHAIFAWIADHVRERGCDVLQLTTDKRRVDAHRFYDDLGFVASHEGMKLSLRDH